MLSDKIGQISAKFGKKKVILALVLLLFGAVFVYLGNRDEGPQGGVPQEATLTGAGISPEPDRDAEVYGMITAIRGNKITILKFDPSTMPGAKKSVSSDSQGGTEEENALNLGITGSTMPGGGEMPAGERPSGAMPARGGTSGSSFSGGQGGMGGMMFGGNSSSREEKLEELKASSIGTETIIVPVGIPILVQKTDDETGQTSWGMGNLTDLTSDMVIILWMGEGAAETEEDSGSEITGREEDASETEVPEEGNEDLRVAEYVEVSGKVDMDNSTN